MWYWFSVSATPHNICAMYNLNSINIATLHNYNSQQSCRCLLPYTQHDTNNAQWCLKEDCFPLFQVLSPSTHSASMEQCSTCCHRIFLIWKVVIYVLFMFSDLNYLSLLFVKKWRLLDYYAKVLSWSRYRKTVDVCTINHTLCVTTMFANSYLFSENLMDSFAIFTGLARLVTGQECWSHAKKAQL